MITPIETAWEPDLWQIELRRAIRSSAELLRFAGIDPGRVRETIACPADDFPVLVPRGFAARIAAGNPQDPLLNQVLATAEEQRHLADFVTDPLKETDTKVAPSPSLLKKYSGRALLITTTACAVNCRYCFRRHFPYAQHRPKAHAEALHAIRTDSSVNEVILSGGDPLLLDDHAMRNLLTELSNIGHINRIRIHSRIPVVLPERITAALLAAFNDCTVPVIMVIHCNHAQELSSSTARAMAALRKSVLWLFNQAVLLKGVNNSIEAQVALAERLFEQGVQPYYLHMPDRVAGTHHFFVDDAEAAGIYKGMQAALPGYLVPRLVREVPGESSKTLLTF